MKKVVVYGRTLPYCSFCEKMKTTLNKKGITFIYKDINVTEHMTEFSKLGVRSIPQVTIDDINFGGFDNILQILREVNS